MKLFSRTQHTKLGKGSTYVDQSSVTVNLGIGAEKEHASINEGKPQSKSAKKHKRTMAVVLMCIMVLTVIALSLTLACLEIEPQGFTIMWLTLYDIVSHITK